MKIASCHADATVIGLRTCDMPHIETLMLIGLGFCLAAFFAVIVIKAMWKLMVRSSQRRAERSQAGPKLIGELDEDALKTEYTKLRRRYELKVEDFNTQLAEHMAELSRARKQSDDGLVEAGELAHAAH